MKTYIFQKVLMLSMVLAGYFVSPDTCFAQQQNDGQKKSKKNITLHITKEVEGKTIELDTTFVTEDEFDSEAFLKKRGFDFDFKNLKDIQKDIVIRHPEFNSFSWSGTEIPDTLRHEKDRMIAFSDKFDFEMPPLPDYPFKNFHFKAPQRNNNFNKRDFEELIEKMARKFDFEEMTPIGEMKNFTIRKHRHGKKVTITFEDRDDDFDHSSRTRNNKRVIIYNNGDRTVISPDEERMLNRTREPGERIRLEKRIATDDENRIIIKGEEDKKLPKKTEKRVIIIKEDDDK